MKGPEGQPHVTGYGAEGGLWKKGSTQVGVGGFAERERGDMAIRSPGRSLCDEPADFQMCNLRGSERVPEWVEGVASRHPTMQTREKRRIEGISTSGHGRQLLLTRIRLFPSIQPGPSWWWCRARRRLPNKAIRLPFLTHHISSCHSPDYSHLIIIYF
ncbi:hypothetical protein PGT21_033385 [Puccinia graminis f. sp. tritici]|uniref:Uncharacterized protein n=1 Tax=Puccinia graminis f. sp. tritici TaxID=56615 RepID=A0A5B0Q783_PUCGR|nr:hypothetical protein PGT21_033385 [Puccinia graminis f. sp. tritici]